MSISRAKYRRNLFELDNAKNLSRDQLIKTFVPIPQFWRLLSSKNHVILGARGSGKTALAKMLSHDHLSQFPDSCAQEAIKAKSYIGMYIPTSVEWVGALKNKPWQTEKQAEEFFQWRLNVASCLAYLVSLRSCLNTYISDKRVRAETEASISEALGESWSDGAKNFETISQLQIYLEDVEYDKQNQLTRKRVNGKLAKGEKVVGSAFENPLFVPLRRGITIATRMLELPDDCAWLLCLDETENLAALHHRILNSYLRSQTQNLFFKITTMPYFHEELRTNIGPPLNVDHDFEYVYIDQDATIPLGKRERVVYSFASDLFLKRASESPLEYQDLTLDRLLGGSKLLERKGAKWEAGSHEMTLLRKYASKKTIDRAEAQLGKGDAFTATVSRKLHGVLLLRDAVANTTGNRKLEVYSGAKMCVRCGDGNPRRLIRIFNRMLQESLAEAPEQESKLAVPVPPAAQTMILRNFSSTTLSSVQSEEGIGRELHALLKQLGEYMRHRLHELPLTTDQVFSIETDENTPDDKWKLVKSAVAIGTLFPNVSASNPDQMPDRVGTFRLAWVLAPYFLLFPRRGRHVKLGTVLERAEPLKEEVSGPLRLFFPEEEEENG